MAPPSGNESWIICPVCHQPNPPGTQLCRHCWGAALRRGKLVPFERLDEVARRHQAYLRRKKTIKIIAISLVSLLVLASVTYPVLYYLTDTIFKPPEGVSSISSPGEWAMFRHDPAHSSTTDSSSTLPQGTLKWVFTTDGAIHSSPAVANGTVYVGSRDFKLYALDAATGTKRWEYKTGSWVESSPSIVNGVVYFGSNDGKLYALDAQSGEKLWDFKTRYPIMSSPAVANGIVYFGADDCYIYALDTATGTKLWDFKTDGYVKSSPVVANGIVYVGSGSDSSYALHALDGRLRLRLKSYDSVHSSPAVSDKTVYLCTANGFLMALDSNARNWPREHELKPYWIQLWAMGVPGIPTPPPQSGLLWALKLGRIANSSPAVANNTLYAGSDNKLIAVDLQSHQKLWEFEAGAAITSSPAVLDNTIYVGSVDGHLYALNASSGDKLWDIITGDQITSSPAVANGTVYIGSHDGKLYAIK